MASPLDSVYSSGVGRLLFQNKTQRDELNTQGQYDDQDFNTMLQRMARQRGIDLLNQNHQANREGLFYSGQLTKRRREVEHDYSEREGDSRRDHDRRVAARAKALQNLGTITANPGSPLGYSGTGSAAFDLQDAYNDAVSRQLERDRQSQLFGADPTGGGGSAPAPPPSSPSGATKVAPSAAHGGQSWVYRQGASGKWIPVRPANAFGH